MGPLSISQLTVHGELSSFTLPAFPCAHHIFFIIMVGQTTCKSTVLPSLSVQFCAIDRHVVVQPPATSVSRNFSSSPQKLSTH